MHQSLSSREVELSQTGAAALDDLIETVDCPNCGAKSFHTVRPASYPSNLTKAQLLKTYSASSDHVLFDAMVQCDGCGLVYLNPRIRKDLIIESYSSAVDPTFIAQNEERIATFKKS